MNSYVNKTMKKITIDTKEGKFIRHIECGGVDIQTFYNKRLVQKLERVEISGNGGARMSHIMEEEMGGEMEEEMEEEIEHGMEQENRDMRVEVEDHIQRELYDELVVSMQEETSDVLDNMQDDPSIVSKKYENELLLLKNLTIQISKFQFLNGMFESDIKSVRVSEGEIYERGFFKEPYYTNICGCIKHWEANEIYKKAVLPFVHRVKNGFGSFLCVSSVECNLLSSVTKTSTLFRGGRNSTKILKVFDHALKSESVKMISVHMLVCSGNVGEMLHTKNIKLKRMLSEDSRWKVESMVTSEENSFSMNFKLENFDEDWIRCISKNVYVETPKRLLLTVSRVGSVNMFLTLNSARFFENIEVAYLPVFKTIFDITCRSI